MTIPAQTAGSLLPSSKIGLLFPASETSKEEHTLYGVEQFHFDVSVKRACLRDKLDSLPYFFSRQKGKKHCNFHYSEQNSILSSK